MISQRTVKRFWKRFWAVRRQSLNDSQLVSVLRKDGQAVTIGYTTVTVLKRGRDIILAIEAPRDVIIREDEDRGRVYESTEHIAEQNARRVRVALLMEEEPAPGPEDRIQMRKLSKPWPDKNEAA